MHTGTVMSAPSAFAIGPSGFLERHEHRRGRISIILPIRVGVHQAGRGIVRQAAQRRTG